MKLYKKIALSSLLTIGMSVSSFSIAAETWSYSGETGPDYWATLSAEYHLCGEGLQQSPIDLSTTKKSKLPEIEYEYGDTEMVIENNGHTVEVHYEHHGEIEINEDKYKLLQFHFHSPSEHTENGAPAAMEVHFVHINSNGQLAVVGALIEEGRHNPYFENIISNAPTEIGTVTVANMMVNAGKLLPEKAKKYRAYFGSLTTPPCSEGVRWYVLSKKLAFSREQIEHFQHIIHANARPTQPLNGRTVLRRK